MRSEKRIATIVALGAGVAGVGTFMWNYGPETLLWCFLMFGGGGSWQERSAPDIRGPRAMIGVEDFVATNGWNMHTEGLLFSYGLVKTQPIRGLPWKSLQKHEYSAVTHEGILYIITDGWHHDCNGLAFNPKTNHFPRSIMGFKPIGDHWYVWAQPEFPTELTRRYEGEK
jgi:hypothetical protein